MSLKTFVKIGKITNLSDARYCAGMMVDILGFNLEEGTEGFVTPETFKEITDWVAGVDFAGEFKNAQASEIKLALTNYPINYVEVENQELLEELKDIGIPLIYKLVISSEKEIDKLGSKLNYATEFVEYVILDCLNPSLFEDIHKILSEVNPDVKLLRSYGISEATASSIANDDYFYGIELEGSPEDRPGFKDYGDVMDILEVLEED